MTKKEILIGVGVIAVIGGLGYYFFGKKKDADVLGQQEQGGEVEEQQGGGGGGGSIGGGGSVAQQEQPQIIGGTTNDTIPVIESAPTIVNVPAPQNQGSHSTNATSANLMPSIQNVNPKARQIRGTRSNVRKGYGVSAGAGVKGMGGGMVNLNAMNNSVVHTGII